MRIQGRDKNSLKIFNSSLSTYILNPVEVKLASPIYNSEKCICVGLNYSVRASNVQFIVIIWADLDVKVLR